MSHAFMLGIDELQQMSDLSGPALYRAEVKRIPIIAREEQPAVIEAARNDDEAAQHALILNCLNWTMRRAQAMCGTYPPQHSDMMDLVGHASLKMMEALPCALRADDPVAYCMTVGGAAMRWYCLYNDPLVQRKRDEPLTYSHPATISLEANDVPVPECPEYTCTDFTLVYEALGQLSKRHQAVLIAAYGLNGEARHRHEEIAAMLNVNKGTVEKYLWRAKKRLAVKLKALGWED
jgi:RNA polymerase sigma factor (sigma-70 family)